MFQAGGEGRGACVTHLHTAEPELGHGRQRARAQPLRQLLHTVGAGCWLVEVQHLDRWQQRAQRAQQLQLLRGETLLPAAELLRLAQLLAADPQLAAQRCSRLVTSLQLRQQRLRRRPQLVADAAQGHGDARVEHVAQLDEEDGVLVAAELGQRHRDARTILHHGS